ncbi:type I secretion membrane fusion protein, HlyD [Rhodobacteraceae bacterium KLH11]|nr:type I secretion membrane fusion protein, HlyD [Rhodobacteraceae bacterium KLH11]
MTSEEMRQFLRRSVRKHVLISYFAIFGLFGSVFAWAYLTKISGAVIAPGTIVVLGHNKSIQHPDGGVVKEIFVKDGDIVQENDLLLRLDATALHANVELARNSYLELIAERARIVAELEGQDRILFPKELIQQFHSDDVQDIIRQNRELLIARMAARDRQVAQLESQYSQVSANLSGLRAQAVARQQENDIVGERVSDMQVLFEKELVPSSTIAAAKRDEYRTSGLLQATYSEIQRVEMQLIELRLQIESVEKDAHADMIARLSEMRLEIVQARINMEHAEKQVSRVAIRAPTRGVIHDMSVHTIGGVIQPAEPVLEILPIDDDLILELKVRPVDIKKVFPHQTVSIQFPGLNARTVQRVDARLDYVSRDLLQDPIDGQQYYTARAHLIKKKQALEKVNLVAGMPAIAFIQTRERTVLDYLVEPLKNQIALALKED